MVSKANRIKLCHLVALVANPFILYGVYLGFVDIILSDRTFTFSPNGILTINTARCNVFVRDCKDCQVAGEVAVQSNLLRSKVTEYYSTGSAYIENLSVESAIECDEFFERRCAPVCSITIDVPRDNSLHLKITQSGNSDEVELLIGQGVSLDRLTVSGGNMYTVLHGVTVAGRTSISTGGSPIEVVNSLLGTKAILKALTANVRVIYQDSFQGLDGVAVSYRATSNSQKSCFMSSNMHFANDTEVITSCLASSYIARQLSLTYDVDQNGKITQTEFVEGLAALRKCCGSRCPGKSMCAKLVAPTYIDPLLPFVTMASFVDAVVREKDYTVVPQCTSSVYLADNPTVNLSMSEDRASLRLGSLTIHTETGVVQVAFRSDQALNQPPDALDKPGLVLKDASALLELRDTYAGGPSESKKNVFATIYTQGSPYINHYHSMRTTKFIYTDQPALLTVPPSVLSGLTFGLLRPEIQRIKVSFTPNGCSRGYNTSEQIENEMGETLYGALKPFTRNTIWGALGLISNSSTLFDPEYQLFEMNPNTMLPTPTRFVASSGGDIAIGLSLIISLVVSMMIMFKITYILRMLLKRNFQDANARNNVLCADADRDATQRLSKAQVEDKKKQLENPLERPIELFEVLAVDPIRRNFTDSFAMFVNQTYYVDTRLGDILRNEPSYPPLKKLQQVYQRLTSQLCFSNSTAAVGPTEKSRGNIMTRRLENSVTMKSFLVSYEKFCFDENIDMEEDMMKLKQRLLQEYGVRVKSIMAERVYGCCWKKVPGTDGQERPRRTCPFDNMQAEVQKRGLKLNPGDGELEVLNLFVAEFCEKTKLSEFISHENLYSLTHDTVQPGFKDAYLSFAAALGLNPKTIKLTPTLIEATGLSKRSVRIETIRNLRRIDRASNSARKQTFSFRWYAMLYLETTVHQVLFTVGPLMILQITLSIEFLQSSTLNPGIGLYAEDLLALHKRVSLPRISELLAVSVHGLLVISVVCNLLLALIYLELNNNPVVEKCVRMGYRLVYSVTLFVLFGFMMMQGIWVMLAAFLQPGHFLPFGASIVAFVGMVTAQYKKIHDVRTNLQKVFKEVFNENMKTQVVNMLNLHSQAKDAAKGAAKAFTDQADYEFDPNDLFTLVTSARTTVLVKEAQTSAMLPEEHNLLEPPHETTTPQEIMTREDFDMLFDILELEILPKKRDILFAYCDMEEGNGQVTRDEFLGAWGWLEEELTSSIIGQSLGLSNFQITVYIVTFAIVLVLMIIFLLNSVATFAVGGNFSSIIQSAAITALAKTSGELSNGFGAAANATNLQSEDTGKIVKGKVDEQLAVKE